MLVPSSRTVSSNRVASKLHTSTATCEPRICKPSSVAAGCRPSGPRRHVSLSRVVTPGRGLWRPAASTVPPRRWATAFSQWLTDHGLQWYAHQASVPHRGATQQSRKRTRQTRRCVVSWSGDIRVLWNCGFRIAECGLEEVFCLSLTFDLCPPTSDYLSCAILRNSSWRALTSARLSPPNLSTTAAATSKATTFSMMTLAAAMAQTSLRS